MFFCYLVLCLKENSYLCSPKADGCHGKAQAVVLWVVRLKGRERDGGEVIRLMQKGKQTILITGISSGFGLVMAKELQRQGHKVYGTSRRPVALDGVTHITADSADEEQVAAAVRTVVEREGRIDTFINNAGMGIGGPLEFSSMDDAQRQMDINFFGFLRYVRHVLPVMRSQGGGRILAVSSIGGVMGLPYQGLYSASKFAIEGYCETLRLEVAGFGIKVVVIRPGDFATGFTAQRKSVDPQAAAVYTGYARTLASIENDEKGGLKPDYLARKVASIIKKRNPANTYVIASFTQSLSIFAKWLLPAKWYDKILSSYYNM